MQNSLFIDKHSLQFQPLAPGLLRVLLLQLQAQVPRHRRLEHSWQAALVFWAEYLVHVLVKKEMVHRQKGHFLQISQIIREVSVIVSLVRY